VTPTLGTPTHASGCDELDQATTTMSSTSSTDGEVIPVSPIGSTSGKLSLQDCVRSLNHKRSFSMLQGPITSTAAQYKEQQTRALESSGLNREIHSSFPSFLSCVDPQVISNRLSSSLNQSMVKISRKVLEQQNQLLHHTTPSNIESAAEALLGLIQY